MKRYLITGASRGIGREIALAIAGNDIELTLHGRDTSALAETVKQVKAKVPGCKTIEVTCDLSKADDVAKFVDSLRRIAFDAVINNAGIAMAKPVEKMSDAEVLRLIAINLTAPMQLVMGLYPQMKSGSSIITILSGAAYIAYPTFSAYCASKFGLEGFTQCLRLEAIERGIRVINIYPGSTDTDIWHGVDGDWPREKMLDPKRVGEAVAFALNQPEGVLVGALRITNQAGNITPKAK